MEQQVPLIILAGSDAQPTRLPEGSDEFHPLRGHKSLSISIEGQPLLDRLLERLNESGCFAPIYLAGPADQLAVLTHKETIIDTDSTFGENIRVAIERVTRDFPARPLAFTTCDILPEAKELRELMDSYFRLAPLDFWFPVVRTPKNLESLGASAWKPRYRMIPEGEKKPASYLPGHLTIVNPAAIRLPLIFKSFQLAYQTRNRPVIPRLWYILAGVLAQLISDDFRHLMHFRMPAKTATVVYHSIIMAFRLRRGRSHQIELEKRMSGIFVQYRHRKRYPDQRGRMPMIDLLSLAKDIDTVEEAREFGADQVPEIS